MDVIFLPSCKAPKSMRKFSLFTIVSCSILFISNVSFGYKSELLDGYQKKYPKQNAVVLNHNQTVNISTDKKTGELVIYETDYEEILYLTESAKFYTAQSIYTSDFFEDIESIKVSVYNEKGKRTKLKSSDFKIVDSAPSSWVFHDDDKEMVFDFPALGEGYRTVIEYTKRIKRPEFFDSFHFIASYPVESAILSVIYPETTIISFYEQNLEKYKVEKSSLVGKKGMKTDAWVLNDLPPYKSEKGSVNSKYYIPHIVAQIKSYNKKGENIALVGSADELHSFFQEFLLLKKENNDREEMNTVVTEITEGMETDLEKMDTIFNWVQANIKYIAFEDGINGYVPRECSTVMNNRYGDCKDMGNLLVEMLTYAGVDGAYVAWVGTRDIPYQMSEIPTPLACNHVICVVDNKEGGFYYLDATGSEGSYILPPQSVQEKELLIHTGTDSYVLHAVPAVEADKNYAKSIIKYHWDEDDSLRGSGIDLYGGYERVSRTYYMSNLDDEDLKDYIYEMVLGGVNRYVLTNYEIANLYEKNEVLKIEYDFAVDNLFIEDGKDLILNPTLFKPRVTKYNNEDYSAPRYKKHHRTIDYSYEFEIPEGYSIKFIPENVKYDNALFTFSGTFNLEENVLKVRMGYQYHLLQISPDQYQEWNDFADAINQATIQNVVFEKQ